MTHHQNITWTKSLVRVGLLLSLTSTGYADEAVSVNPLTPEGPVPQKASPPVAGEDVGSSREVDKPLEINGQTRNLSMMMVLKDERDHEDFFEVRRNYQKEVSKTVY